MLAKTIFFFSQLKNYLFCRVPSKTFFCFPTDMAKQSIPYKNTCSICLQLKWQKLFFFYSQLKDYLFCKVPSNTYFFVFRLIWPKIYSLQKHMLNLSSTKMKLQYHQSYKPKRKFRLFILRLLYFESEIALMFCWGQ